MKTFAIFPNPSKDRDFEVTKAALRTLLQKECRILMEDRFASFFPEFPVEFRKREKLFSDVDFAVTLGGDGTILSVARDAAPAGIPLVGINLGTVGFLADLEAKDLPLLLHLFDEEVPLSRRMLLEARVNGGKPILALNECTVACSRGFRMMGVSLLCDGQKLCDYRVDGLIFATPTGTTGYSFSAGGAVIDSALDCIGVKAICSYLPINSHQMVFRPDAVFTLKDFCAEDNSFTICADGREEITLTREDSITIRRAEAALNLVSFSRKSNLEVFFRKF